MNRLGAALLIPLLLIIAVACNEGGAEQPPPGEPSPLLTAEPTTSPPLPPPTPTPGTPAPPAANLAELLASLDPDPRPTEPDREERLPAQPVSPYPPHDRESTVLYDTQTGERFDFGPGDGGFFSPDSRYMAWRTRGNELRLLDLDTREERSLGPATWVDGFVDERTVHVVVSGNARELVDVETGQRTPSASEPRLYLQDRQGDLWLVTRPQPDAPAYLLENIATGETLAEFKAAHAVFAGPGELVVVTPWSGTSVNLYLVDIHAVEATFIATVALDREPVMPLGAAADVVAWTENYCNWPEPSGATWFLDRERNELVRLDRALWVFVTPDGRLGHGEFGPEALVDRETLRFDIVLPEGTVDINWSPDYRYASHGMAYGHGGYCPL